MSQTSNKRFTDAQLVSQLQDCAKHLGHAPSAHEFRDSPHTEASASTIVYRFGSWNAGLAKAGFAPNVKGPKRKYTDADLFQQMREVAGRIGHTPSAEEFDADKTTAASAITLIKRFGSWGIARKKAGLTKSNRKGGRTVKYTDAQLLDQLTACALRLDTTPTVARFDNEDLTTVTASTIIARFGSWNKAKAKAGLTSKHTRFSNSELLGQIHECTARIGHAPSAGEFDADEYTKVSSQTFYNRFGSWTSALKQAEKAAADPVKKDSYTTIAAKSALSNGHFGAR